MPLNNQRIPIPQSDPSSRQHFSPSPSTSPSQTMISTESCYCCFVLFQTSAFNHSNYRCKDWCISQSCAFHFNVIQESNLRLFIHPIQRMLIALIVAASSVVSSLHFEKRKNKVLGDELIMLLLFKDYCKLTYPPPPP